MVSRHHGIKDTEDGPRYAFESTVPFGETLLLHEWRLETGPFLRYAEGEPGEG